MWFFDSVLDDTSAQGTAATGATQASTAKKDEQDGSFLIIKDDIKAETLPDTAVQLFDAAPAQESAPASEISFFSSPVETPVETVPEMSIVSESAPSSEIAFFDEPTASVTEPIVIESEPETDSVVLFSEEPVVAEVSAPVVLEEPVVPVQEEKMELAALMASVEVAKEPEIVAVVTPVPEKDDIYAPINEAIAKFDKILEAHGKIFEAKGQEIADYNSQISELKTAAKKALDEQKTLSAETDKIKQMRDLFISQLK